jgi:hypothetical protein
MATSVQGRFLWEGLMTVDPAAAGPFYNKIAGWTSEPWPTEPSYMIFSAGGNPVAGMTALPEATRAQGGRGAWLTYIGSEDVDAGVSRAEGLGGKVSRPASDMTEVGRVAVMIDPQGAAFGIFKPLSSSQPRGTPQHGQAAWHELSTPDPEAALKFYQDLFGWELMTKMDMGPSGFYYIFGSGGTQLGGIYKPSHPTPGPAWLLYVSVPDADKAATATTKAGGHLLNGPMDVPGGGRIAQLSDPHGVQFAVHSMKAAPAAAPPPSSSGGSSTSTKPATPKPAAVPKPAAAPKPASAAPATSSASAAAPKPATKPAAAAKRSPARKKPAPARKKAAPSRKKAAKRPAAKRPAAKKPAAKKSAGKKKVARKTARSAARKVAAKRKAPRKSKRGKQARRKK